MHRRPSRPTNQRSARQTAWCWLLAVAVLVQSVWLVHHLASERHFVPGVPGVGATPLAQFAAAPSTPVAGDDDARDVEHTPHCAFEHATQKHKRSDGVVPDAPPMDAPACAPAPTVRAIGVARMQLPQDRLAPATPAAPFVASRAPPRG
jgi:hypothetical protein